MSYGNAPQKQDSGRGLLLLIIFGIGIFLLFNSRDSVQSPEPADRGSDWGGPPDNYPEFESIPQAEARQPEVHPDAGDWEMEAMLKA